MKVKAVLSIITIALAAFLLGGGTIAWFYSRTPLIAASFTTGFVNVAITEASGTQIIVDKGEEPQPLRYTFTNKGSMAVYLRVRLNPLSRNVHQWQLSGSQPWQEPDKDGWWYYPHPVEISQEISITLIPKGFGEAQYRLEVDAVQAANRAKDFVWGKTF